MNLFVSPTTLVPDSTWKPLNGCPLAVRNVPPVIVWSETASPRKPAGAAGATFGSQRRKLEVTGLANASPKPHGAAPQPTSKVASLTRNRPGRAPLAGPVVIGPSTPNGVTNVYGVSGHRAPPPAPRGGRIRIRPKVIWSPAAGAPLANEPSSARRRPTVPVAVVPLPQSCVTVTTSESARV